MAKYAIFTTQAGSYNETFEGFYEFEDAKGKKAEDYANDFAYMCANNGCTCKDNYGYYSDDDETEESWVHGECECDWRAQLVNDDVIHFDRYNREFLNAKQLREIQILNKKGELSSIQVRIQRHARTINELNEKIQEESILLMKVEREIKLLEGEDESA